ncbi:4'-phosphopantetheinyl transferase family protein [Streptomyces sp. HC307]|uniref:4'-phosphopantetheinyl transferase family protein n=1 Tax=Streptomyces flavusporus TaxID=3385496 RepID=UPI003916ECD3
MGCGLRLAHPTGRALRDLWEPGRVTGFPRALLRVLVRSGRSVRCPDPRDLAVLSPEEKARARRFREPRRAAAYAAAHAAARRCLGERLGSPAGEIHFGRRPCPGCGKPDHGRPVVDWPRTSWESSLSRSGPHWLFAAADGVRIGVDIERVRPVSLNTLSSAVLSEAERDYLADIEPYLRQAAFIRCWTRKEAVVKASGIGIEAILSQIDVQPWEPRAVVEHRVAGCPTVTWAIRDLPAGPGYSASLALPAEAQPLLDFGRDRGAPSPTDIAVAQEATQWRPPPPVRVRTARPTP